MVKKRVENESKNDKFVRIATRRTQNILHSLQILGNCANQNTYSYTEDEVNKIFKAIRTTTEEVKKKFTYNLSKSTKFEL